MSAERRHRRGSVEPIEFLRHALAEPLPSGHLRQVTIPAPAVPLDRLPVLLGPGAGNASGKAPDRGPGESALYWAGRDGTPVVGRGAAVVLSASGPSRFDAVRRAAGELWSRISAVSHADAPEPAPRLFGGFAFQPGRVGTPWESFGDARFHLPRIVYSPGPAPTLSVTVGGEDEPEPDALVAEATRVFELLSGPPDVEDHEVTAVVADTLDEQAWRDALESIHGRILAGETEKIVAARRTVLRLARPADVVAVLQRLERENAAESRFALSFGAGTMVAATPERLVSRRGRAVRTEALAGSIGAELGQAERLLASGKDAEEHAYVVAAIASALEPLCESLDYPDDPSVKRLRHVLHLHTPFEGRLAEPVHVLELVQRLHPTPAVGGTPTAGALEWIAGHEPADRGWYAAPVGWFDARGDGDFVVALRSGLLEGDRAYLYAGAGIVRDSDAAAEFQETETKLRTMMDALGITT